MGAYPKEYLYDVVENQGKLFDLVAIEYPESDTKDFINTYMNSKTRQSIDVAQAYVSTMDYKELLKYFISTDNYVVSSMLIINGITIYQVLKFLKRFLYLFL